MLDSIWRGKVVSCWLGLAAIPVAAFAFGCSSVLVLHATDVAHAAEARPEKQRYVVVLEESAGRSGTIAERHAEHNEVKIDRVFTKSFDGYAATMMAAEAKKIARRAEVVAVGLDPIGQPAAQEIPLRTRRIFAADPPPGGGYSCFPGYETDVNQNLDIDCTDDVRVDVDIAVLDTPIDPAVTDLNLFANINCFGGDPSPGNSDPSDHTGCAPGYGDLGNASPECALAERHGEIVAGPMAAIDNGIGAVGVAAGARVWSVGVADNVNGGPHPCGAFYLSDVIAGVEWVTAHASTIEVANMSMQFDTPGPENPAGQALDQALEEAIEDSISAGVVYVAAAGNMSSPLTGYIPAKYNSLITATAMQDSDGLPGGAGPPLSPSCTSPGPDYDDTNSDSSNFGPPAGTEDPWGPGADIAAPADCTSLAAALTSGAAAILASADNPGNADDVADIRNTLLLTGNTDSKEEGGWDDATETGPSREPLLDVGDEEEFDPAVTASFWAYTPDFEEPCPKISRTGNEVTGGCLIEDFEGSFDIMAYLPQPYYIGTYDVTFDLILDSTGEGYAVDPAVQATGPWFTRVACDDTDMTVRPWPVNSYSPDPLAEEIRIDILFGLRAGGGWPGDACTHQVMTVEATRIGWGWNTELDQVVPAPNLSDGHFESEEMTWILW